MCTACKNSQCHEIVQTPRCCERVFVLADPARSCAPDVCTPLLHDEQHLLVTNEASKSADPFLVCIAVLLLAVARKLRLTSRHFVLFNHQRQKGVRNYTSDAVCLIFAPLWSSSGRVDDLMGLQAQIGSNKSCK